ncbi:MAG: hypothetical protein A3F54_00090 [Candidatus Kerfeldbacteria bacterium RIFCSPHIGHO2_12_FULL_48_17]|uniref:AB hydrolase-1 domain-containing protein n=1 Tax=Candidatus Kerfeldbacteria bacterium RIFCSPHIGHO2_12_FULL_48_17 TaxID=1798542 RepID=A0A1G2B7R0_9BACT|nr:MAG: hypothetical protein A3F54_00090 [Candidatus Kerfeldbacteria bacterium RIFCSPHIGHO2_12_FULL_48_17]
MEIQRKTTCQGISLLYAEAKNGSLDATPVLLVHGACGSAQQMADLMRAVATQGHPTYAVELQRPHDPKSDFLSWFTTTTTSYAEDIAEATMWIEGQHLRTPALVGHSQGCYAIWRFLEQCGEDEIPLTICIAPPPLKGALIPALKYIARHPLWFILATLTQNLLWIFGRKKIAMEELFPAGLSLQAAEPLYSELKPEPYGAFLSMLKPLSGSTIEKIKAASKKIIFFIGRRDKIFNEETQQADAQTLRAPVQYFDATHGMVYTPYAEEVAKSIIERLKIEHAKLVGWPVLGNQPRSATFGQ